MKEISRRKNKTSKIFKITEIDKIKFQVIHSEIGKIKWKEKY